MGVFVNHVLKARFLIGTSVRPWPDEGFACEAERLRGQGLEGFFRAGDENAISLR